MQTTRVARAPLDAAVPPLWGWVLACVIAESIGMTAASAAARLGLGGSPSVVLSLVVAGGLIEGIALGVLQGRWLSLRYRGVSAWAWTLTTVLIAGLGWALASAVLGGPDDGATPPLMFVLVMAGALGLVMGALMGAAQAFVLRRHVRHPWRWVGISAAAWTPAMVIIFAGATLPDASWATLPVIVLGAVTGALAGAALGGVSAGLMPALTGPAVSGRLLGWMLRHHVPGLGRSFALLRLTGRKTGQSYQFPVQYAREGDVVVVHPGGAERKTWWRNLRDPATLMVWVDGAWRRGTGQVLSVGSLYSESWAIYRRRFAGVALAGGALLVRIQLET